MVLLLRDQVVRTDARGATEHHVRTVEEELQSRSRHRLGAHLATQALLHMASKVRCHTPHRPCSCGAPPLLFLLLLLPLLLGLLARLPLPLALSTTHLFMPQIHHLSYHILYHVLLLLLLLLLNAPFRSLLLLFHAHLNLPFLGAGPPAVLGSH